MLLVAISCRQEVSGVGDFFRVVWAGPLFFVSAWVLMIFVGIASQDLGIHPVGYITSMVVTIGLWLTVAPAIGAVSCVRGAGPSTPRKQRSNSCHARPSLGGARH